MNKINLFMINLVPGCWLARIFGAITRIRVPNKLLNLIIKKYVKSYKIDMSQFVIPEKGFKTFDKFFTRTLNKGARPIASNADIVSPVDGRIDQYGRITKTTLIQAKGLDYKLEDLIPSSEYQNFIDGDFMTIYLSPADYHRIHTPVAGTVYASAYYPGRLFTVQRFLVESLKDLFVKNERLISFMQADKGKVAVCKIGAINVGRISTVYNNLVSNTHPFRSKKEIYYEDFSGLKFTKGEELATFHLGSTVILLFEKDMINFSDIEIGSSVKMGEAIANLK